MKYLIACFLFEHHQSARRQSPRRMTDSDELPVVNEIVKVESHASFSSKEHVSEKEHRLNDVSLFDYLLTINVEGMIK